MFLYDQQQHSFRDFLRIQKSDCKNKQKDNSSGLKTQGCSLNFHLIF